MRKILAIAVLVLSTSGCYHATIQTGVQPGAVSKQTVWAHSWLYGLVPPKAVNAAEKCGGAQAASVDTYLSVPNQLVSLLTGWIYTPMTIEVTCGGR